MGIFLDISNYTHINAKCFYTDMMFCMLCPLPNSGLKNLITLKPLLLPRSHRQGNT